jgi:hypothetical protein
MESDGKKPPRLMPGVIPTNMKKKSTARRHHYLPQSAPVWVLRTGNRVL